MILPSIYPSHKIHKCVRSLVANHFIIKSPFGTLFWPSFIELWISKKLSGRICLSDKSGQWLPHNPCKKDLATKDMLLKPCKWILFLWLFTFCHGMEVLSTFFLFFSQKIEQAKNSRLFLLPPPWHRPEKTSKPRHREWWKWNCTSTSREIPIAGTNLRKE